MFPDGDSNTRGGRYGPHLVVACSCISGGCSGWACLFRRKANARKHSGIAQRHSRGIRLFRNQSSSDEDRRCHASALVHVALAWTIPAGGHPRMCSKGYLHTQRNIESLNQHRNICLVRATALARALPPPYRLRSPWTGCWDTRLVSHDEIRATIPRSYEASRCSLYEGG